MIAVRALDADQLVGRLAERGIVTSSRAGNVRISPHCYNTAEDIEQLLVALRTHRALLGH
jgi:selenocysteine lyase/cysteine desulfurase